MAVFVSASGDRYESSGPISVGEALKALGVSLDGVVAARVDGVLVDLGANVEGGQLEPVLGSSEEGLDILRHSASHLMAQAVMRLFPGAKLGIGPSIKDGFYYDILFPSQVTDEDLPRIEEEMMRIVRDDLPVERLVMGRDEALELFRSRGEDFKLELISEIQDDTVSLYRQGEFVDLCRGPHVPRTGMLKHVKLLSLAGAYWRGDEKNVMLTRIYGTAFMDGESLGAYLNRLEEARQRDHRKIGREMDLFSIQPEGPGFPFFHPKGMVILNELVDFWKREHKRRGYNEIRTPLILDRSLWERSGHWDHYRDNMYFTSIDDRPFAIKPMNCPGGILVFKSSTRSYRDLPLRMSELGVVHRHERSGVLHGLMRVRCFTQDDAHIYCTPDQVGDEIAGVIDLMKYVYSQVFGFNYRVELSTRPDNYMGSLELWNLAEEKLKQTLEATGTDYKINPGDGAFYGPKIDFHLEDSIGRTWQCGTIQLDFQMPEKFDVSYVGADGADHRPVMIHRTVFGSLERFLGILIEHYAGAFPFWLAPVQVRVLPVKPEFEDRSRQVEAALKSWGVRVEVDVRDEKLGKKIRDAQLSKVPYMIVIGAKEAETGGVSVRHRSDGDLGTMSMDVLRDRLQGEFKPS
ncbi:threonyl-tRNA synthetase [Thermanaerovibrio acidaminovorans DSM 6589]|jgi:threonyl-tRNA synthetase|uniref:Threonine--tRNA ligase n=1 Tax=Thermanaerovibrio acidaminovorans (strain ATCC 49978 / DSM 6589 / Su883) TaxID=525903 RepID=D1B9K3_THEAS|nr:threonine--tRNA ligase [Thermanaerovibrio acidaminovorans]ACZ18956.1 threonyl-tRNA synthetase [Thermanaerovibrio acidaminovorans DSM 6589]